jgi:F-type H+-transporting ATPase subunit b
MRRHRSPGPPVAIPPTIRIAMRALLLSLAALLLSATPLVAQEADHAPPGLLDINVGLMFWTLIIFFALMFILRRYAFGPITAAVQAREKALEEAILTAKRDREEAAKLLEQHRAQIEAARSDAQRMIADGRAAGEKLRGEMLEETRAQQQELLERARREIAAEKDAAIRELRAEAVDLAIAGASRVIEKNLDDRSNREIIEKYLSSLDTAR